MPPDLQPGLAVAITTHDNARTIRRVLESVKPLADLVVVVDSGSTDGTIEICRELGAEVIERPWAGHVKQKQFAMDRCRAWTWTLLLDSDESLEPPLQDAVRNVVGTDDPAYDGWSINRKLWFLGGWLDYTCQPEWRLRLVRSDKGCVAGVDPHDRLEVPGRHGRLAGDLRHDSYASMDDLARRSVSYAELAAANRRGGGTVAHLLVSPLVALLKQLVLHRAFLDGRRGLLMSCIDFNSTLLKHTFIAARRIEERDGDGDTPDG